MSAGRIEQIGSPREIYYRPANRHVAQFVGTINRVAGHYDGDGDTFTTAGGKLAVSAAQFGHVRGVSPAGETELFFRPEDARLVDAASAPLRGIVEAVAFLGERTRITVTGAAPDPLVIDAPGRVALSPGDAIGVEIAAEGLIALA
ncbi:TOBE domain-containing protein [Trinickia sp. LjRoot230]